MARNEHKRLVKAAEDAIDALFSDRSVSDMQTLSDMEELQSQVDGNVESLKEQIKLRVGEKGGGK